MQNKGFTLRGSLLLTAMAGLAACSSDNREFIEAAPGDTFVVTSSAAGQRLLSFDRATPGSLRTARDITGLASGERIVGADFRPADGNLYAVTSASRVLRLNPSTGAVSAPVTLSVALDSTATDFGVDFNPVPDRLRVVSNTGQNLRINVADGATTVDGTLKQDRRTATAPDVSGITATAYTMSFKEACRTTIYYINNTTGNLMTSADPNAGTVFTVGSLGLAAPGAVNGFDVLTGTAADGTPTNSAVAVLSVGGVPTFHTINLASGAATAIGPVSLNAGEQIVALTSPVAASPTKQARGELVALTASNKLVSFNRGSPAKLCTAPTDVTGLGTGENVVGIDTRPATGELYGLTDASRLVVINPDTGAATERAMLSTALPAGSSFGVDFNPVPDRLRVVAANGVNLRIDPRAGITPNVTTDVPLSGSSTANVTAVAYSNSLRSAAENVNSTASTALFGVDTTRDQLVRIGSDPASGGSCAPVAPALPDAGNPNCGVVADVGALGVNLEAISAFEIDGANGAALLAGSTAAATSAQLYTVNLATGAAVLATGAAASSTIGGGELIRGLALVPATLPGASVTVFALLENGTDLVSFLPSAAATPSAPVAITGLAGGETLLDIDFRVTGNAQRNRVLVGVSNQNRLYDINPATGAATNGRVLKTAAGTDVVLSGGTALDFNPVPDLLRLITTSGQNLRINVDSATGVTMDSTISGATTGLMAAAYTNSFVGTTATALYGIDAATGALVRVGADPATGGACTAPADAGNPNCGVVTTVGLLGVVTPPLSQLGDMDIVGGRNGYALAALQPSGGGLSTLVRVNLGTGAATTLGTIGAAGAPAVRSIALRVQ